MSVDEPSGPKAVESARGCREREATSSMENARPHALPLNTPFGISWEALNLEVLSAFFRDAGPEPLTWEAKAGDIRPNHIRKAVCAFGNSARGGCLVLGLEWSKPIGEWQLVGWAPADEPELWVENCVGNGGVDPMPSHLVKAWPLGNGRQVAVVFVRPVAVPPCITSSGEVYERVAGASVPVRDSVSLRHLFERGETAVSRVAQTSVDGRADLAEGPPESHEPRLVVSLASPSLPSDISALLFRESTYRWALNALRTSLCVDRFGDTAGAEVNQHALTVWNWVPERRHGYAIRLGRHGSVAVGYSNPGVGSALRLMSERAERLETIWKTAAGMLRFLGAYDYAHVAIRARDPQTRTTDFARHVTVDDPSEEHLASLAREASRALGSAAWEPEESPPAPDAASRS